MQRLAELVVHPHTWEGTLCVATCFIAHAHRTHTPSTLRETNAQRCRICPNYACVLRAAHGVCGSQKTHGRSAAQRGGHKTKGVRTHERQKRSVIRMRACHR
jgi:hypothetical protein